MYTQEKLSQDPYFAGVFAEHEASEVFDALTGVVARPFITGYVRWLIEAKRPFTFAILDLDNFKFINDTYGHKAGDGVLMSVASDLSAYLEGYGLVGRFGGDEFLFVNLRDLTYDDVKRCYEGIYANFTVLRKNIALENYSPFITGTIGSATYPADAADYEGLFEKIDKTLYRGKTKGRNCYIIYVEAKHKDIEIKKLAGHGLYHTFHELSVQFDSTPDLYGKMRAMLGVLQEDMRITELYYINRARELKSVRDQVPIAAVYDIDHLMQEDLYATNEIERVKDESPFFYEVLVGMEMETMLLVRIGMGRLTHGYLMCAEMHNRRIWQEDEQAILFSVARMLAGYIMGRGVGLE